VTEIITPRKDKRKV